MSYSRFGKVFLVCIALQWMGSAAQAQQDPSWESKQERPRIGPEVAPRDSTEVRQRARPEWHAVSGEARVTRPEWHAVSGEARRSRNTTTVTVRSEDCSDCFSPCPDSTSAIEKLDPEEAYCEDESGLNRIRFDQSRFMMSQVFFPGMDPTGVNCGGSKPISKNGITVCGCYEVVNSRLVMNPFLQSEQYCLHKGKFFVAENCQSGIKAVDGFGMRETHCSLTKASKEKLKVIRYVQKKQRFSIPRKVPMPIPGSGMPGMVMPGFGFGMPGMEMPAMNHSESEPNRRASESRSKTPTSRPVDSVDSDSSDADNAAQKASDR
jgi:hypothetical protein